MQDALLFLVGLALLTLGADWLVRGAAGLAQRLGVSPLVVGLTVVAFGTSAPELVVSGLASLDGLPGVAVGNVMGSTAANVGLIVGLGALIRPIAVHRRLLVRETPLVIFVLSIVVVLSLNETLGRLDGFALVSGWALYLLFLLRWGSGDFNELQPEPASDAAPESESDGDEEATGATKPEASARDLVWSMVRIGIGIPCLTYGAQWLLDGAQQIAATLGIPEPVIAATMIAIGTSLPELATTLAAAFRAMGDIAIGNVIGSNVFNLGLVLGTAALLRPLELHPSIVVQYVLPALAFTVVLIPLALTKGKVGRTEGGFLLLLYVAYVTWLLS